MRAAAFWLLAAALSTSGASLPSRFQPSAGTCSAAGHAQLEPAPLSTEGQKLLENVLPQPTSQLAAVRGELRAPFHIPCQLQAFPHLNGFVGEIERHQLPNFEVKEFAQPPHLIFFDQNRDVVRTVVVSPMWNGFELRDLIRESLGS